MRRSAVIAAGVCGALLLFYGCLGGVRQQQAVQSRGAEYQAARTASDTVPQRCARFEAYRTRMRGMANSGEIYLGTGMAAIKDIGKARQLAKQRALSDLAQRIRVKVESDLELITGYTSKATRKSVSENIQKSMSQRINTYSNIVLEDVKEGDLFIDCPRVGTATFFVYIPKDAYLQKVREDIKNKLFFVKSLIGQADSYFENADYLNALKSYLDAANKLADFFGDLPVNAELAGQKQPLAVYLNTRITALINGVTLEPLNSGFLYSVQGVLNKAPRVFAAYIADDGRRQGIANLPLTVSFIKGKGRAGRVVTGRYGEAEIPVNNIDASHREVILGVGIDWERIKGMNKAYLPAGGGSALSIALKRKKTVGLAVNFVKDGRFATTPDGFQQQLVSLLTNNNYGVLDVRAAGQDDLRNQTGLNVSYVLIVNARASGGNTVGGYQNMHVANCSGTVLLFRMPSGALVFNERVAAVQGFGISAANAGWDAFGRIQPRLLEKVRNALERID